MSGIAIPAQADVTTASLNKLRDGNVPNSRQSEKTAEAVKQLEALFVSMMIKQMRQTESGEGMFPGDSGDTLGGIFDEAMGQHIAESGGLGLAAILEPPSMVASPRQGQKSVEGLYEKALGTYQNEFAKQQEPVTASNEAKAP